MDKSVMERRVSQWIPILEAQAKSGLPKGKWCEENGIKRWEFFRRQHQIRQCLSQQTVSEETSIGPLSNAASTFVELPIYNAVENQPASPASQIPADGRIDIKYKGFNIEIQGRVDDATLNALIRSLSHA